MKEVLVIGDSHTRIFTTYQGKDYKFEVSLVSGATSRGLLNPNSSTNALNVFENKIANTKAKSIIIMLGEVDCGFLIWYRNQKLGEEINIQVKDTLDNLFKFIKEKVLNKFKNSEIIVCGSVLPTIEDNADPKFLSGARSEVNATLEERIKLTLDYNNQLKERCNNFNINYIEITDKVFNIEKFKVYKEYLNEDPHDHHLNHNTIKFWINQINKIL